MRHTKDLAKLDPSTLTKYELQRVALRRYWRKKPPEKRQGEGKAIDHMTKQALLSYIAGDHPDYP